MNEIKLYTNIMTNYYDEMIAEIKQNIADGDYAQAFELASLPPTRSIGFSLNVKF